MITANIVKQTILDIKNFLINHKYNPKFILTVSIDHIGNLIIKFIKLFTVSRFKRIFRYIFKLVKRILIAINISHAIQQIPITCNNFLTQHKPKIQFTTLILISITMGLTKFFNTLCSEMTTTANGFTKSKSAIEINGTNEKDKI